MKRILFILSFFISASLAAQNTHVVPTGSPSPSALGSNLHHYGRVFNVVDYGAKHDGTTDDIASIQLAVNACVAAGGGNVYFPSGVYSLGNSLQTSVGGIDMNSQIYLPYDSLHPNFVTVNFIGEIGGSPGNVIQSPFSTTLWNNSGVVLYSQYTGTHSTSVKGTAILATGSHGTNDYNLNCFTVSNINFLAKANPNSNGPEIGGANSKWCLGANMTNCTYGIDALASAFVMPQRDISGFESPDNSAGASYTFTNMSAFGIKYGFIFGEHVSGDQLSSVECYYGFGMKYGHHASSYNRINSYWCTNGISFYPYGTNGPTPIIFDVKELDIEYGTGNSGKYYNTNKTIVDSLNKFTANVRYASVTHGTGHDNSTYAITGGSGVSALPVGASPSVGGSTTQVQYNSSGVFAGDPDFVWDAVSKHLGIGTNAASPTGDLHVHSDQNGITIIKVDNHTAGANAQAIFQAINDLGYGFQMGNRSSITTAYGDLAVDQGYIYSASGINAMVDGNGPFTISTGTGAPAVERFKIDGSGNFTHGIGKFGITEGSNGRVGQVALIAGTKAITITGLTTSSRAFPGVAASGGTAGTRYIMACTANTLTITAVDASGTIVTTDTSTVNYFIIN